MKLLLEEFLKDDKWKKEKWLIKVIISIFLFIGYKIELLFYSGKIEYYSIIKEGNFIKMKYFGLFWYVSLKF